MNINIPLAPEIEARLRDQAAAAGKDVSAYAQELLQEVLTAPTPGEHPASPVQAPPGDMSDDELDS